MKIKDGVSMAGLRIQLRPVLVIADKIWQKHGKELVVTSTLEGNHSAGSLHYYGFAVDLRTLYFNGVANVVAEELRTELRKVSSHYDVVVEVDHIHVEWDPYKQQTQIGVDSYG